MFLQVLHNSKPPDVSNVSGPQPLSPSSIPATLFLSISPFHFDRYHRLISYNVVRYCSSPNQDPLSRIHSHLWHLLISLEIHIPLIQRCCYGRYPYRGGRRGHPGRLCGSMVQGQRAIASMATEALIALYWEANQRNWLF